jgi:putative ABC transport system permease protein
MGRFTNDLRLSLRALYRRPGITWTVILMLALGIAASSVVFAFVNTLVIQPLPFPRADQLVILGETNPLVSVTSMKASFPNFQAWQKQTQVFTQLAAFRDRRLPLILRDEPITVVAEEVSPNFFSVLGVQPALGPGFRYGQNTSDHEYELVISYPFWMRAFHGDPHILWQSVVVNNELYRIVGIMPASFYFVTPVDVWIPLDIPPAMRNMRGARFLSVIGRLHSGITIHRARSALRMLAEQLANAYPKSNRGWTVTVLSLHEALIGQLRVRLLILFAAVSFLLLLTCANVGQLLLTRAASQHQEFGIRIALGARSIDIVRYLLCQSIILGLGGCGIGILFTWCVLQIMPGGWMGVPDAIRIQFSPSVLAFSIIVAFSATVLFGLSPSAYLLSKRVTAYLARHDDAGGLSFRGFWPQRLRAFLIVTEIGITQVLVIGAGLFIISLFNLMTINPGFRPDHVLTAEVSLPAYRYAPPQQLAFFDELLQRIRTLPTVTSAGLTNSLPLRGIDYKNTFTIDGHGEPEWASVRTVSPGYFDAMKIPFIMGRNFTAYDSQSTRPVIIVNRAMAAHCWPDGHPLGRRVAFGRDSYTVIGVVADVKETRLEEKTASMEVYRPFRQDPQASMTIVVRIDSADPMSLTGEIRAVVQSIDKEQPIDKLDTMADILSATTTQSRSSTVILGLFAVFALAIAATGVYGLIAYSVSRRTREIGIRKALGAQGRDVIWLVVKQGMTLVLVGTAVGLIASIALSHAISSVVFGVRPSDPTIALRLGLVPIAVALVAIYLPARRAANVEPAAALRYE